VKPQEPAAQPFPVRSRAFSAVVLGARGMLGSDLVPALRADPGFARVEAADLPKVDITDPSGLRAYLAAARPDVVFNCAAYTDVDGCESRPDLARTVNAEAAGEVADAAASRGALLIHVSTDFVFDGRKRTPYVEEDPPAPLSVYGASKLEGERRVAERGGRWLIVRTAWLYGASRTNFVDRMLQAARRAAREGGELRAVTDRVGSPTWTADLARILVALARRFLEQGTDAREVFHAVNRGACSRHEEVEFIVRCANLPVKVRPVTSSSFPRPACTPAYSALSTEKLRRTLGQSMRPWQDALREYLLTSALPGTVAS